MSRYNDPGQNHAFGITEGFLSHARRFLLSQGNTSGYSTTDLYHQDVNTKNATYSVKAQRTGKTLGTRDMDEHLLDTSKTVDPLYNNRPDENVLAQQEVDVAQETKLDKTNLIAVVAIFAGIVILNKFVK